MSPKEVEVLLQKETAQFQQQTFPQPLPDFLIEWFKTAYMNTLPKDMPCHAMRAMQILEKKVEDLNIYEVGLTVNFCLGIKPVTFGLSIEEYLQKKILLEALCSFYNKITKEEEDRQKRKQSALLSMGGKKANNMLAKA